ncbi:ABC-2 type transport system ATP-binding protein [Pseudomonas sp. NFACC23-1]|uniref:ATP-binding cassette domain-containing protein n=1 Tax=unclassified Pseudomonas TaxID=196821 RepID=UPI00088B4DA8|nr:MULTISPECIES: AAA family ATPase [unclassified Pseudomonas]SDB65184.1 ABC-2 type transport system ATP-binding protein [Pseudomonas sp. NFACC17-2]SEJ94571.1 ABC-2 type transport system ATP-binding protein [Pseudomonas sp. NFACC23-1]SFW92818.1 ABC-2 type transport system ATP-binding protein [Pseudomonas sp. NFACC16-2]
MTSLHVKHIDFAYDKKTILSDANLEISQGAIVGLLGPNGSGKTSFFDLICKLKFVQAGRIDNDFSKTLYLSQIITTPPALRMHDIFRMIVALSSDESISQFKALENLSRWCPEIVSRYKDIWNKKTSLCSYGETRWFFTLSLLAIPADFIILDEPTAGVDPEFRHYIWRCLKGAAKDGTTILVSSHQVEEITTHCDMFYMISQRRLNPFQNGAAFMQRYNSKTLDDAFIQAATDSDWSRQSIRP